MTSSLLSVAVCGKIRDPEGFSRDLAVYEGWLQSGQIARLVFCGWQEDRDHPLIGRLLAAGARVILLTPPGLRSTGNFLDQAKTLHYALQEFEDDDLVLRSRTDKVWLDFDPLAAARRWHEAPAPAGRSPFARRVCTNAAMVGQPFFFNDMMLLGRAGDLRQMACFDLWADLDHALANPEQLFHYQPFIRAGLCPATGMFLRVNPGITTGDETLSRDMGRFLLGQPLYLRALAESLLAFEQCYTMGLRENDPFVPPLAATLEDLYDLPLKGYGLELGLHSASKNLDTQIGAAIPWMLDLAISRYDGRSLRGIAAEPAPSHAALKREAAQMAVVMQAIFPRHPNLPVFAYEENGVEIVPSRRPMFTAG